MWDLVLFGKYFLLFSENGIIEYDGSYTFYDEATTTIPLMHTACMFNGQIVGGWVYEDNDGFIGPCIVRWSQIGNVDFTVGQDNIAGARNLLHGDCEIRKVMKLGNGVMAYTNNGVSLLVPIAEPTFSYSERTLTHWGIPFKGAVGGDENQHLIIDNDGVMWMIDSQYQIERKGYQWIFENLDLSQIAVIYDGRKQEFYISDGTSSYLMTRWGLCEIDQIVTGVIYNRAGEQKIFYEDTGDDEGRVVTDVIDSNQRGYKTLTVVEVGGKGQSDMTVAVDYLDHDHSFARSSFIPCNPEGMAFPVVSSQEYRVAVHCDDLTNFEMDYLNLRFKFPDKRAVRGMYNAS